MKEMKRVKEVKVTELEKVEKIRAPHREKQREHGLSSPRCHVLID